MNKADILQRLQQNQIALDTFAVESLMLFGNINDAGKQQ
jgi:hypothetical protein